MYRALFLLAPLFLAACNPQSEAPVEKAAEQDNLFCNFTEPFFTLEFDASSKSVLYSGVDTYDEKTGENEKREFASNARIVSVSQNATNGLGTKLELRDGQGKKLLDLTVDFNGSDGMSDNVYPITALQQGKYGPHETGCTTTEFGFVSPGVQPKDADAGRLIEHLVSR